MNDLTIKVRIKNCYGIDRIYPVCEKAKLFCKLVGLHTLTQGRIETIKKLGYTVENILETQYL